MFIVKYIKLCMMLFEKLQFLKVSGKGGSKWFRFLILRTRALELSAPYFLILLYFVMQLIVLIVI